MTGSVQARQLPVGVRISDVAGARGMDHSGLSPLMTSVVARLQSLGVGPGDVVIYLGPQQASALVLCWACLATGAIFTAIDGGWPAFQLAQAAGGLTPRLVISPPQAAAAAASVFPAADGLTLEPTSALGDLDQLADWASRATEPAHAPQALDDARPAACLFTSGSSGTPKGVLLTRAGLAHSAQLTLETFDWRAGERLVNLPDPHTMSGLRNGLLAAPLGGLDWIPLPVSARDNLFATLDALAQARPQRLVVGPLFLRQLTQLGDRLPAGIFDDLKAVYCTGAALDAVAAERLHDRWGVPVINYYGLTETGGLCLSQPLVGWRPGDQSLGRPAGCEARLVGEDGAMVGDGASGELQIRSPQLMSGYLGDPAATAARFDGDWLRTGDLARRRPDGAYDLIGRAGAFINTVSTERVHPEEIELILERHAAVAEAAVFGRPEAGGGERIIALVVTTASATPAGDLPGLLAAHVADHLGSARRPSLIRLVDALPRHGNGKLIRPRLPELAH